MPLCTSTQKDCEAPHRGVLERVCSCVRREYPSVSRYAGACVSVCIHPSVMFVWGSARVGPFVSVCLSVSI